MLIVSRARPLLITEKKRPPFWSPDHKSPRKVSQYLMFLARHLNSQKLPQAKALKLLALGGWLRRKHSNNLNEGLYLEIRKVGRSMLLSQNYYITAR